MWCRQIYLFWNNLLHFYLTLFSGCFRMVITKKNIFRAVTFDSLLEKREKKNLDKSKRMPMNNNTCLHTILILSLQIKILLQIFAFIHLKVVLSMRKNFEWKIFIMKNFNVLPLYVTKDYENKYSRKLTSDTSK